MNRKITLLAVSAMLMTLLAAAVGFAAGTRETAKTGSADFSGSWAFGGSATVLPITGVLDGVYVLGGSSRELNEEEIAKGAVPIPIALDGIAVIANGNVVLDNLSLEQVSKVFTGAIRNWKELGGKNAQFLKDAITVESNGDMVTKVGSTPYAIGFCGLGYLDQARNAAGKEISVNGVDPSLDTAVDGSYAISRKLFLVHKGELKAGSLEKAFVEFVLSKDGQAIVKHIALSHRGRVAVQSEPGRGSTFSIYLPALG
jgi:phosphate transport system substrate-binding protein